MKIPPALSFENRPVAIFFAEPTGFATALVEQLLSSFCRVKIFTQRKNEWRVNLSHLGEKKEIDFIDEKDLKNIAPNYVIYLSGTFCSDNNSKKYIDKEKEKITFLNGLSQNQGIKGMGILPLVQVSFAQKEIVSYFSLFSKANEYLSEIFCADFLGARAFLSEYSLVGTLLKGVLLEKRLRLPEKPQNIYFNNISTSAKKIVRKLFSFKSDRRGEILVEGQANSSQFFESLEELTKKALPSVNVASLFVEPPEIEIRDEEDLSLLLKKTIDWYKENPLPIKRVRKKKIEKPIIAKIAPLKKVEKRKSSRKFNPRAFLLTLTGFLGLLVSPYLFMALGSASLFLSAKLFFGGNTKIASYGVSTARILVQVSDFELGLFEKVPYFGELFAPAKNTTFILKDGLKIAQNSLLIISDLKDLGNGLVGKEDYDLYVLSENLALSFDKLYKDLGFLESEWIERRTIFDPFYKKSTLKSAIKEVREKSLQIKNIVSNLPETLGMKSPLTYLVLFQNNMELRPTGGFIGSFALVTVEKGKIVNIDVRDVYSADGQLKGHVEPPAPIKEYLGEANWFLRDSNWDPDFPTSAARAEWFLDKEIDQKVEGVIALDLEAVRSVVGELGEIILEDYGVSLDKNNFYEVTQKEAEKDFFPGSRRKANFLASLSKKILSEITNSEKATKSRIFYQLAKGLEQRNVQLFLHHNPTQKEISGLGWDGRVEIPTCPTSCYQDYLAVVEANLGVNKANLFIEREHTLQVKVGEDNVVRSFVIKIVNTSPETNNPSSLYKDYLRIILPTEATVFSASVAKEGDFKKLEIDENYVQGRKEAGFLLEVPPGEERRVQLDWLTNLSEKEIESYQLFVRKQAGTLADPLFVKIEGEKLANETFPDPSLTDGYIHTYNTNLARDFSSRIFW